VKQIKRKQYYVSDKENELASKSDMKRLVVTDKENERASKSDRLMWKDWYEN